MGWAFDPVVEMLCPVVECWWVLLPCSISDFSFLLVCPVRGSRDAWLK